MPGKVSFWARFRGWSGHLRHLKFLDFKEAELKSFTSQCEKPSELHPLTSKPSFLHSQPTCPPCD